MLDVSLGRLYRAIATWRPPTRRLAVTCSRCLRSRFRDAAALELLPEEVVHKFLIDLDLAVAARLIQLRDEREAQYSAIGLEWDPLEDCESAEELASLVERADEEIWRFLASQSAEIDRTRRLYLEPRLRDWMARTALPLDLDPRPDWLH